MKKINKFTKCLAIGALVGLGTLTFAGCTNMQVTDQQADNILQTIEQSSDFMDELLTLLNTQNNRVDLDEGYSALEVAIASHRLNANGEWDNMMTVVTSDNYSLLIVFGKTSDDRYFTYRSEGDNSTKREGITIEIKGETPNQSLENNTEELYYEFDYSSESDTGRFGYNQYAEHIHRLDCHDLLEGSYIKRDSLKAVRIDENGAYEFVFIRDSSTDPSSEGQVMTILRMSNDYKFISMDVTIDRDDDCLIKGHYDFSYGNADVSGTEARINELFAMYEASKNS